MKKLKTKKFWLQLANTILGWIIPKFRNWCETEITIIKQKLLDKILEEDSPKKK